MPEPSSAPRLDTAPAFQPGYAPMSWLAVASAVAAAVFVVVLTVLAVLAKQPLVESWLFIFPAVGVVLAFTARRQIEASEGTRTGLQLASGGWWVSVMVGAGYVAYLLAINYAVENDAKREFTAWAETVKAIDPANPRDPKLYEAVYRTVPPRSRAQVKDAKDTATADKVFRDELAKLRQLDVVRIAGRNRGEVAFTHFGVRDWQQTPGKIQCALSCKMETPEGERTLLIPLEAEVGKGPRQWQIVAAGDGFVQPQSRELTRYGWLVDHLELSGRQFAGQFLVAADAPEARWFAYQMFVLGADEGAAGIGGATVAGLPAVIGRNRKDYEQALGGPLFSLPNGAAPGPDDRARFRQCWERGGIRRAGGVLRENVDVNPVLRLAEGEAELRVPVELSLSASHGNATEAARGKLVLRTTDPTLLAELATTRQAKGVTTPEPPKDVTSLPVPWRIVRIESDLKPIQAGPAPGGGGPGGESPPGMFGG